MANQQHTENAANQLVSHFESTKIRIFNKPSIGYKQQQSEEFSPSYDAQGNRNGRSRILTGAITLNGHKKIRYRTFFDKDENPTLMYLMIYEPHKGESFCDLREETIAFSAARISQACGYKTMKLFLTALKQHILDEKKYDRVADFVSKRLMIDSPDLVTDKEQMHLLSGYKIEVGTVSENDSLEDSYFCMFSNLL